ncbi:MAG: autotransporter outer membrane beta-barrel domain-containing protein [Myxococcaceae bacterium]|nr:autotransporter outer membrane beta-barrel domain-containing protein [Myxococcaceae bacterium]MCI0669976.1 autotransporter outer membrane beta-barrel domain-containing protein [Myxococcaceae bacterium]
MAPLLLALTLASTPAPAPAPAPDEAPQKSFGLLLDAGVPDVLGVSLLYRPVPWLRVNAGVASNTVGWAARAGAGVAFPTFITPSLNVDVGRYFPTDYRPFLERLNGGAPAPAVDRIFQRFGYDFASAMLGLELGSPQSFAFFVRAGISYWSFRLTEEQTTGLLQDGFGDDVPGLSAGPFTLRMTTPAAKVGFLLYFF